MKIEDRMNRPWVEIMIKDMDENLDLMDPPYKATERYLRGRLHLMKACFEEDSNQGRGHLVFARSEFSEVVCTLDTGLKIVESEVLAEYLSQPYTVPFLILDKFQTITRSYHSRIYAETLVRIFLINKFVHKKISKGNIPLYSIYEHYTTATLNGGYRAHLLKLLRHTAEEDMRVPTLLTELPDRSTMYRANEECIDSEATTDSEDEEDNVPKSGSLLHHCYISEQAWCIGSTRCRNCVRLN